MQYVLIRIIIKEEGVKTSELEKLLKKNKCFFVRHGSSHDIWKSPISGNEFTIPRHRGEMKTGTVNNILKEAGLK